MVVMLWWLVLFMRSLMFVELLLPTLPCMDKFCPVPPSPPSRAAYLTALLLRLSLMSAISIRLFLMILRRAITVMRRDRRPGAAKRRRYSSGSTVRGSSPRATRR